MESADGRVVVGTSRLAARCSCASGSGAAAGDSSRLFFSMARPSPDASHWTTQPGGSPSGNLAACASQSNSRPRPCLQGNFRLGLVHLNAGSPRAAQAADFCSPCEHAPFRRVRFEVHLLYMYQIRVHRPDVNGTSKNRRSYPSGLPVFLFSFFRKFSIPRAARVPPTIAAATPRRYAHHP